MIKLLFCVYHERDEIFFIKIGNKLNNKKYDIYLLYFIKPSIDKSNLKIINFYDYLKFNNINNIKIKIPKDFLNHEKLSSFKQINQLKIKFTEYENIFYKILNEYKFDMVFQELGGFICHLSLFQACKKKKVNHIFIEPSFLKKYCFFLVNTLKINEAINLNNKLETLKLLNLYRNLLSKKKYLAVNFKDLHLKKKNMILLIFSFYTWKSFFTKIKRIILFEWNEFNHLLLHIFDFLNRTLNFLKNSIFKLEDPKYLNNFIYFPLHVPRDLALTLRAPSKLDQIESLKKIIRSEKQKIIFKEHPLVFSRYSYNKVTKNFFNASFVHNAIPTNFILNKCKFVITINSKAGIESLMLNKPVLSLYNNYYCGTGLAFYCKNYKSYKNFKKKLDNFVPKKIKVRNLILKLAKKCLFFDLYNMEKSSLEKSFKSILYIILKLSKSS